MILVALINLAGSAFGFYYYQPLFRLFPGYLYIFISNSPNATLLFAISIFLLLLGRKHNTIYLIAMANNIKYGLWTMLVILYFSSHFLSPANKEYYYLMFLLHFGMVIQPVLIIHLVKIGRKEIAIALLWLLINDFFDYVLWLNPLIIYNFPREAILKVGVITTFFSFLSVFSLYYLSKKRKFFARFWSRV
ncbi:hypothetical protein BMS3Bbin15_01049 [archaeon BMS3Bbin15]|nr:hypothetical protein BMS3Bbin15_01049 [archaeon BMS3Bbin15]